MKTLLIAGLFLLLPLSGVHAASTDYYLKIDGVDGETKAPTAGTATLTVAGSIVVETGKTSVGHTIILDGTRSTDDGAVQRFMWKQVSGPTVSITNAATAKASVVPAVAGTYVFELMVTDANGRSVVERRIQVEVAAQTASSVTPPTEEKKGNVEVNWKVEEGEKSPGVEPDEIDYQGDDRPQATNFSVLLGGKVDVDDDGDSSDTTEEGLAKALEVLTREAKASDNAIEHISLNYEKISTKVRHQVKLFGFIPIQTMATVDIDANGETNVRLPWWTFLAAGSDTHELGHRVSDVVGSILDTHADALTDGILLIRY